MGDVTVQARAQRPVYFGSQSCEARPAREMEGVEMRIDKRFAFLAVTMLIFGLMTLGQTFGQSEREIRLAMSSMNDQLEVSGKNVRLAVVEYITTGESQGQTVYFNDRAKQMETHWVPGDPRRGGYEDIAWLSDQVDGVAYGLSLAETQAAVGRALETWQEVECSTIPLTQLPDFDMDWGYVQWMVGMGGVEGWFADITQAGWLPGNFFEWTLGAGASEEVLGVTFTLGWIDDSGDFTDINGDGKDDVAFREIYYNNAFDWGIDTNYPIDTETIVLHETGHGLSQDHFGRLSRTSKNGKLHFAPRSLMNAGYTGVQQRLTGTDIAGHCSIWASWPR